MVNPPTKWVARVPDGIEIRTYRKTSNISRTLAGNNIVENSDVVGASPVGAAPTTSSFSTLHLASMDKAKQMREDTRNISALDLVRFILKVLRYYARVTRQKPLSLLLFS